MAVSHFFFWDTPLFGLPLFFLIHAMGQAFLETCLFFLIATILNRKAPQWLFHSFIGFSFAVLLIHFVDFTIIRLMDAPISYLFRFFFGSGLMHIITAFQALNVNPQFVILSAILLIALPLAGIALYRFTYPLAKKLKLRIPTSSLVVAFIALFLGLYSLDLIFHPAMDRIIYRKYKKTLPLGTTFIPPEIHSISLAAPIAPFRDEQQMHEALGNVPVLATKTPNIFLFIVETFRSDFATPEIAPNLSQFGAEHISFEKSYSNANGTHPSWFAIFHADYPYHWTAMRDHWNKGSIPLHILKQLGYTIRVYSSADLSYFGMDRLIFGEGRQLADQVEEFSLDRDLQPCDRDALCFQSLYRDLNTENGKEKNLFIVFLDATHSEYSFPKEFPLRFLPIVDEIDYLTLTPQTIEPLKNRYRNAIRYIDGLFGTFFSRIKDMDQFDSSILAITGDHAEEFFEDGALFHGTHLNDVQTSVPIYYKFQTAKLLSRKIVATHLDIFPSILHDLTGEEITKSLCDGQSLFSANRSPYRIAVLQNGPDTPLEFTLQSLASCYRFRFVNSEDIYASSELEILSSPTYFPILLDEALAQMIDPLPLSTAP